MTYKISPYKTYTKEFKLEAIRLMEESGHTPSEIAMQLGIRRNQLYKWKEQVANRGEAVFSGKRGRPAKEVQSELATLKQENVLIMQWQRVSLVR
jgi:transposase